MRRLMIANRGEIAVRIVRACRDAGITSIAVYSDSDRDARHVRLADEAVSLGGVTAGETYLNIDRIIRAAQEAGADAIHPGYGFLSENADFAEAVGSAGLVWIGPPPAAIRALGDKVSARKIAAKVGAPLASGGTDPVTGADEVVQFAREHGLPVAIKAAHGGGGRGLKVARTIAEIPELYAAAVREAEVAFGRGECFVERYLERTRHIETQCLADRFGNAVVVSTRDCSVQRRYQKLVEEAPAPFLTPEQVASVTSASEAILRESGYIGAATCEFLLDSAGDVWFLEVNTRLQVEHPVTEEVTGVDLVREQFRLAQGEAVQANPPRPRGHAIEFRINGEDAARNFLPSPGVITTWRTPEGPGVRLDSGVEQGTEIGVGFDSMLAKLIVVGATRQQAIERARRALAEFEVDGLPTVLPFHRALVEDPAFASPDPDGFTVHTRWIESEFDNRIEPYAGDSADAAAPMQRHSITVEVGKRRVEVKVPASLFAPAAVASTVGRTRSAKARPRNGGAVATRDADTPTLTSPMHGSVVRVAVEQGQQIAEGELVAVLEAMKMEQPVHAHRAGTIDGIAITVGSTVTPGEVICEIHPK